MNCFSGVTTLMLWTRSKWLRLRIARRLSVVCLVLTPLLFCIEAGRADEPIRLTHDRLFKRDPVFIEGGKEVVYVVLSRPEQLRLMRMSMSDGNVRPMHEDETRSELEPAFSPDGRYYAYLQSRSAASVGMVIRDTKDQKDVDIPPAPGFAGMRSPAFSADGTRLIYSFAENRRQHIFSIDLQGGDRQKLIDSIGINNWASYSSDGKRIVFGSTRDGNFEIYVMDADGSNVQRLTDRPSQEIRPRFSPDGKRIAFTSNRDGNYEIYVMNVDGTGLMRLTRHPERDDYPSWHPDGKRIVVVSERSGQQDLYLMQVPE